MTACRWFAAAALGASALALCAEAPQRGRVVAVRYWSLGDVTRIAIETGSEVRYRADRVPEPDRIFFDLSGTKPQQSKGIQTIAVGDKLLKQIRIAETSPGVTRVVLDVENAVEYSASQLSVPQRLIIELRAAGKAPAPPVRSVTGSREIPDEPAAEETAKAEAPREGRATGSAAAKEPARTVAETGAREPGQATAGKPAAKEAGSPVASLSERAKESAAPVRGTETARAATETGAKESGQASRVGKPAPKESGAVAPNLPERAREIAPPARGIKEPSASSAANEPGAGPARGKSTPSRGARGVKEPASAPAVKTAAQETAAQPLPGVAASETGVAVVRETSVPAGAPRVPKPAEPVKDPGAAAVAREDSQGSRSLIRALGLKIGRVVLDPGHGGHDTGTIGPGGLTEKELVLDVAKRLGALISSRLGSEVVYTRTDDTFVPLETRTAFANDKKADLFLSIHANSSRVKTISGPETFYLSLKSTAGEMEVAALENATSQRTVGELQDLIMRIASKEKMQESREFASSIQTAMFGGVRPRPSKNRGVKKAPFVVLIGAHMPSVLAEIGFLSNPREERSLRQPEYRNRIAEALFKGLSQYANTLSHFQVARGGEL